MSLNDNPGAGRSAFVARRLRPSALGLSAGLSSTNLIYRKFCHVQEAKLLRKVYLGQEGHEEVDVRRGEGVPPPVRVE